MDYLDNINCPQYVNFESEMFMSNSLLKDVEASPCSSVKDDKEYENMDTENGNSYCSQDNQSHLDSIQSPFSESHLSNSICQESVGSVASASYETDDFPVNHAKNQALPDKAAKKSSKLNKTTKVQPFHLTESKKRKRENEHNEHIPLAEQIVAFQKKTPQRFHTTGHKAFEPMQHWSPTIVKPKSPNLQAAKRRRGVNVLSREEQEQKEAEEMKSYKFRARPVNQSILQRPHLPNVGRKMPTKPQNLHLRTAQRAAEAHAKRKAEEKPYEFHARPIPKVVLNGPKSLKEKSSLPVTEAKTPNFALKRRAEKWKSENKLNETTTDQRFKALPAPAPSLPFTIKHEKKSTEIKPFSFDTRDKERIAQKEQKIMEELEKENAVYIFKAQPLPSPTPCSLPAVAKKPATVPQPFNFHMDGRSSKHSSFNLSMDQTWSAFKAQPATVLEKPPFIPEKTAKPPVEVIEFHLHTDVRASERQKLKEINDIKEQEKELAQQRLRQLQEEEERQEIQKLRKEAVHKANPIRHYKPVEIKPSSKPPTQPLSPKFKTDERLQLRH